MGWPPSIRNGVRSGSLRGRRARWNLISTAYPLDGDDREPVRVTRQPGIHRVHVARNGAHFVDVASSRMPPAGHDALRPIGPYARQT